MKERYPVKTERLDKIVMFNSPFFPLLPLTPGSPFGPGRPSKHILSGGEHNLDAVKERVWLRISLRTSSKLREPVSRRFLSFEGLPVR